MTTTTRSATVEERKRLEDFVSPTGSGRPRRTLGLFVALPAGAAALVFANALPVPVFVRLLGAVAVSVVAFRVWEKAARARYEESMKPAPSLAADLGKDLADGRVAVARYDLAAVVKVRPDPRRQVATTWFAKRADGAVLLLVQPQLEEAEAAGDFPATAFEIASGAASGLVVSLRRVGEALAPEVVREPLSDAEWEELGESAEDEVPLEWEEVLERARRKRVRETDPVKPVKKIEARDKVPAVPAGDAAPPTPPRPIRPK